jgi:putative glycosyltransferase (TIGR04372 family)
MSPLLLIMFLIKPFFLIRFGHLDTVRIGTISILEDYLLNYKIWNSTIYEKKRKIFDIWAVDPIVCNKQFLSILKRNFFTSKRMYPIYKTLNFFFTNKNLSRYFKFIETHLIKSNVSFPARLDRGENKLGLTKKEIQYGETFLNKFGIPKNAKIVCFTVRDSLYNKKKFPSEDFSYHNYRDSKIENYLPAIKELIKRNFYVVRMGRIAEKKINIKNKKFIDYAFHPLKNDLMDFYFAHKCHFWICSNTGLDEIAVSLRKPVLDLNVAPVTSAKVTSKKTLICCKIYKDFNNKKISLEKTFDKGAAHFSKSENFEKAKIKLVELNKKEIKDCVLEMLIMIKNSWKIKNKKDNRLQKKYKEIYSKNIKLIDPSFVYFKMNAFYSLTFLKKNSWFLNTGKNKF